MLHRRAPRRASLPRTLVFASVFVALAALFAAAGASAASDAVTSYSTVISSSTAIGKSIGRGLASTDTNASSTAAAATTTTTATATPESDDSGDDSSDDEPLSCFTRDECCLLCGADSIRCARGPCSDTFVTKKLFSFSLPTTDVGFWDAAFAFYGMVPYLAFAAVALELAARRRLTWTRVFAFWLVPLVSVLTSSILVRSLGHCAECARPCGSCIKSTGMPSGHSTNATACLLWITLESLAGLGRRWPLRRKAVVITLAALVFAPVPYSRYYLGDHTALQVAIGSANGVVLGFLYFALLRYVLARRLDRASRWLACGRFRVHVANDYCAKSALAPPSASTEVAPTNAVALEQAYVQAPATPLEAATGLADKV